jgi:O-acetylhomoserine/O-acetylserine sulfhydrylase-like pyridoxal-dependent enzyme
MSENPGVERYIKLGQKAAERRAADIAEMKKCRFDTIAVHGLYTVNEALNFNQGATVEPVYMGASQGYRDSDEMEAALSYQIPTWAYSRIGNPSMYYFEQALALLESYGGDFDTGCCATSSGMAAIAAATDPFLAIDPANPNQKINFVSTCQVYGGTYQQFSERKARERGIELRWVINSNDMDEWESKIDENTRFVFGELPSNPSQAFFDLKKVVELAHSKEVPVIIDNTVATPALLRPLVIGADIVIQSVTKTITSSGTGVAGAVIARKNIVSKFGDDFMKADFALYIKAITNRDTGQNISPMQAILSLNDMRTLRSKVDMMSRSTQMVAEFMEGHKAVESVAYLGLPSHPLHKLASEYLYLVDSEHDAMYGEKVNRFGHLMSFNVAGPVKNTRDMFDALKRIWRATDLGRIKSIATIPAISTHQQQGEEGRNLANIPQNLVRLCVGGEHPDDVIADLSQALDSIGGKKSVTVPYEYSVGGASGATVVE